ncbi:MAG: tetratricopeptide repeat protein [Candidatus Hermodarchaeota archaeon]
MAEIRPILNNGKLEGLPLMLKESTADKLYLAGIQAREEDPRRAMELWDHAAKVYMKLSNEAAAAKVLEELGKTCSSLGKYAEGASYLTEAMKLYRKDNDIESEARASLIAGQAYSQTGEHELAISILKRALNIYRSFDTEKEAETYHRLSIAYTNSNSLNEAISHLKDAINIYKEEGDLEKEYSALVELGNLYRRNNLPFEAIKIYKRSLKLQEEIKESKARVLA